MTGKFDVKSLALGLLLGAGITFSLAAAGPAARTAWDYKTVEGRVLGSDGRLDNAINAQVAEGWDFVSATHMTDQWGFAVLRREVQ